MRQIIDISLSKSEEKYNQGLERLEREVVNCFLRRDEKWERKLLEVKLCSTPNSPRLLTSRNTTSQTNVKPLNVSPTNFYNLTGLAGASSFCANPPI